MTTEGAHDIDAALAAIYERLPQLECQKLCGASCGPIVMSGREWDRIALAAGERECADDLFCPYLEREHGLCGVYALRPLICRAWGASESLRCAWGCEPDRVLSDLELGALIEEVQRLSAGRTHSLWRGWYEPLRHLPGANRAAAEGR